MNRQTKAKILFEAMHVIKKPNAPHVSGSALCHCQSDIYKYRCHPQSFMLGVIECFYHDMYTKDADVTKAIVQYFLFEVKT